MRTLLVDYPVARTKLSWVTHVKSSLLNASIVGLRETSNYDRYVALVPVDARETVLNLPAGPKDAEVHIVKNPLAQIGYWRTGLRGIVHALAAPLATRLYVRAASRPDVDDLITYHLSWA